MSTHLHARASEQQMRALHRVRLEARAAAVRLCAVHGKHVCCLLFCMHHGLMGRC